MKRSRTKLYLPFKGKWFVFWGGDTKRLNAHHDVPNQRYAFDFDVVDRKLKSYRNSGRKNQDYYSFDKEILSPAVGIVIDVINGVRENKPGSLNPYSALGNAVFIQHQKNEISVIAHLKLKSIRVKVGNKVGVGDILGLCGNSGNSSQPHLHYHLQDIPAIQDSKGIKCFFQKVLLEKDGKRAMKTEYSPKKGDIVSSFQ